MTGTSATARLLCVFLLPLAMGPTCLMSPPAESHSLDDLAAAERAAIQAAVQAAGAFSQATGTSQSAAGQPSDAGQPKPGDVILGTCPEVTTTATLGEAGLDVTVDFQDGCTPGIAPDYSCSGNASGQIYFLAKTLALTFGGISCSGDTVLSGTVDVVYALSAGEIVLDGDWDLTYTAEGDQVATSGSGTTRYDLSALVTMVTTFAGTLGDGDSEWTLAMDEIVVSYASHESYIPYEGMMTVSGTTIRTLTIRFDANSPGTGNVDVSIAGSPFFTVNLYNL